MMQVEINKEGLVFITTNPSCHGNNYYKLIDISRSA